jgi:hypothetical protein
MTRILAILIALGFFLGAVPARATTGTTPTPIPDDFPLALRIAENESDGAQPVPGPDARGVSTSKVCGERWWPPARSGVVDRLGVRATGPEYLDARELVSMRSARVALQAVARIRRALAGCTEPVRGAVWTVHAAETGYDSITFTLTYTRGLGASVFQVLRVGKGVLITQVYGEGTLESSGATIRRQTRLGRDLAGGMCVFARAGC